MGIVLRLRTPSPRGGEPRKRIIKPHSMKDKTIKNDECPFFYYYVRIVGILLAPYPSVLYQPTMSSLPHVQPIPFTLLLFMLVPYKVVKWCVSKQKCVCIRKKPSGVNFKKARLCCFCLGGPRGCLPNPPWPHTGKIMTTLVYPCTPSCYKTYNATYVTAWHGMSFRYIRLEPMITLFFFLLRAPRDALFTPHAFWAMGRERLGSSIYLQETNRKEDNTLKQIK